MSDVSALYAREFQRFTGIGAVAALHTDSLFGDGVVRRIRGSLFCAQVTDAIRLSADGDLGFRFGAAVGGRGFGLLGISTATAPTLAHALNSLSRWESLTSTLGRVRVSRSRQHLRLAWDAEPGVPGSVVEGVLSGWISFGRFLANEALPVEALELAHKRSRGAGDAEAIVGCRVKFGARENAVVAPVGVLDAHMRFADDTVHAAISPLLDDSMRVFAGTEMLSSALTDAILAGLESGDAREGSVAARLGFTRRTLQRHLVARGFNYRQLLDLIRANTAVLRLSEGDGHLLDIAHRVGYHEQATLTRAVRRWTGRSPREMRRLFAPGFSALRI